MTVVISGPDRLTTGPFETPEHALGLLSGLAVALGRDVDVDFLLTELASGSTCCSWTLPIDQARRLVRDATEALAPTTTRQPGLRTALSSSAMQLCAHGGPQTVVRQSGRVPVLDPATQVAVVRATQRLLALLRQARAVAATVHIDAGDREVSVRVRANELIAVAADTGGSGLLATLRDARAWLSPIGGSLEMSHDHPAHGFVLRAPTGTRRPAQLTTVPRQRSSARS